MHYPERRAVGVIRLTDEALLSAAIPSLRQEEVGNVQWS